jgi:putative endonuclease
MQRVVERIIRQRRMILAQSHRISVATPDFIPGNIARMKAETTVMRGCAAEQLAAQYLQAQGVRIVARNLRCRAGEIDLVALDGSVLAIVEVRQRACSDFGGAGGSITWRKRRKIIRATRYFWQLRQHWRGLAMRFDVLAVEGLPGGAHRVVWIKDAFRAA